MKDGISYFGALAGKRPLDKADRIRLSQREWRVATENEMCRVKTVGFKASAQIRRLKTDGVVVDRLQIGGQRTFEAGWGAPIWLEGSFVAVAPQEGRTPPTR